jgi:hypothetical protein
VAQVAASVASLALAFSPLYWSQAVIAEVYSLNALFVAVLLLFTLENVRRKGQSVGWSGRLQSLVVGLSLGNHLTVALPAAVWFLTSIAYAHRRQRWPVGIQRGLWVSLGLLVYLYLPLRAASLPPVNWGNPVNWSGFWWVVSGQPYQKFVFGLPLAHLPERLLAWGNILVEQFGGAGVIIGFVGVIYGKPEPAAIRGITIALAVGYSVFAIGYGSADSSAYLLPVYLIFAFWIGLGANTLIIAGKQVGRWAGKQGKKIIAPMITVALIVWLLWRIPATMKQVDASSDNRAIHFATSVLSAAPEGAIILTSEDRDTFSLWYYHFALGKRPDVRVIVESLLHYAWYRNHIQTIYPDLHLSDQWPWRQWPWQPERENGYKATISPSGERLSGHAPVCSTTFDQKPFIDCKRGIE